MPPAPLMARGSPRQPSRVLVKPGLLLGLEQRVVSRLVLLMSPVMTPSISTKQEISSPWLCSRRARSPTRTASFTGPSIHPPRATRHAGARRPYEVVSPRRKVDLRIAESNVDFNEATIMTRLWLRWLPAVAVPAVIAAGALGGSFQANAAESMPTKTPEQVLAMVSADSVKALSGTLEQTSELGLPQLPAGVPSSSAGTASALDLLAAPHTARVYLDGMANARVQVMDQLAERDVIRHGNDVWTYSSKDNSATHETLPAAGADGKNAPATPQLQTPDQLAQRMLAALDSSTAVTVGQDTSVAGRRAYDLLLTPRNADTLVGSVSIAVDSQTGLPLSVAVQARGQETPAFRLAFTDLVLQAPSADLFTFTPPPGAQVTQRTFPKQAGQVPPRHPGTPGAKGGGATPPHTVSGTGWDTVIGLPATAVPADLTASPLLAQAARAVDGGRLLSTSLVNVLLTNDGRVFAGSVPLARLQAAAAGR